MCLYVRLCPCSNIVQPMQQYHAARALCMRFCFLFACWAHCNRRACLPVLNVGTDYNTCAAVWWQVQAMIEGCFDREQCQAALHDQATWDEVIECRQWHLPSSLSQTVSVPVSASHALHCLCVGLIRLSRANFCKETLSIGQCSWFLHLVSACMHVAARQSPMGAWVGLICCIAHYCTAPFTPPCHYCPTTSFLIILLCLPLLGRW